MVSFSSQISIVLLLLLFALTLNKSKCCNEKDRWALLIFKQGVVDPPNRLSSWSSEEDCCAWAGVQCHNITGRVTKLDLSPILSGDKEPEYLRGEINLSLLELEFLNYLDLSSNRFESIHIPPIFVSKYTTNRQRYGNQSLATPPHSQANFSNLHYLDLSYNNFGIHDLRWLSRFPSLKYLDLSWIDLGNETNWLQTMAMLPSISELHLRCCSLRNISPSVNYVNFTSLVTLDLFANNFKSELPKWLFNLTNDISYIDLSSNYLHGQIPKDLLKIRNLKSLILSPNQLQGSIPNWLGQHEHLQNLDLSYNWFYGSIPSTLGNLSSLAFLDLSYNHLSGNLPKSLAQLSNLKSLRVGDNSLVGVLSKTNFAKLSNLKTLVLDNSGFAFNLDPNWVPPFQLRHISLRNTSLGPNFPAWLYAQRSLEYMDISLSGISSTPEDMFWSLVAGIQELHVSYNSISGDLSNVTLNCSYIHLEYNNFTGGLPHISPNVKYLDISHNSFSGPIFPLLCHKESVENKLSYLEISYNLLTGPLPDCWANWKQLSELYMGNNKLTGEVPPSMTTLYDLVALDLHNNDLFGEFSLDLSNWKSLEYLNLERNKFSGSTLNMMQESLVIIKLRSNQFTGNIPPHICNLQGLIILDLADNKLSGVIPLCVYNNTALVGIDPANFPVLHFQENFRLFTKGRELGYPITLLFRIIDLSENNLYGEIPKELFSLIEVQSLNLSRNHLTGKIPEQIGGMRNLESLDLSYNKLCGEIPQSISNLSFLSYLNLSYNSFTGQIPLSTQLQSFDAWSFIGNLELCGAPLPKNCRKQEESHEKPKLDGGNEDEIFLKSLYLGMGVGFAMGFWGVCGAIFFNRACRHRFFRWFDCLVDRIYVTMALRFKIFH